MESEREVPERRRGMNEAHRLAVSELAMVTAALVAEEEELARGEEEV